MTAAVQAIPGVARADHLTGTPRAGFVDRWIYVFTAASFLAIVLVGFIPDSIKKVAAVEAGARAPFPLVLHAHAVLMASFLILLLAQTWLMATGREDLHRRLGRVAMVLVPALVAVGILLVPTMYHLAWQAAVAAAPARAAAAKALRVPDDILLMQVRIGVLFPLFVFLGLRARLTDGGVHKRLMILATAVALPAAIDRIAWLPTTFPASPIAPDLYTLLAVSPMVLWDVLRNRSVNRAYWIWLAGFVPASVVVNLLWDQPGWHAAAHRLMGV